MNKEKLTRIWIRQSDYKRVKEQSIKNHRTAVGEITAILDLYFKKPLKP